MPPTDNLGEVKLLTSELNRRFNSGDFVGLEALEPRVQAASVLEEVAVNDRASMLQELVAVYSRVPRWTTRWRPWKSCSGCWATNPAMSCSKPCEPREPFTR